MSATAAAWLSMFVSVVYDKDAYERCALVSRIYRNVSVPHGNVIPEDVGAEAARENEVNGAARWWMFGTGEAPVTLCL